MDTALLSIRGLSVSAGKRRILHDLDLTVDRGEIHVLMGPNGAGKSTLGQAIMGRPDYRIDAGRIVFDGEDITGSSVDARSRAGIYISFQAPVEVPGVPLNSFLKAVTAHHEGLNLKGKRYKQRLAKVMDQLQMDPEYLNRELNVGFSGGEKKKIEMLQLLLLQPKLAILDETDSGLDVDALAVVSKAISVYLEECGGSLLMITHNTRILEHLDVDRTHVMVNGRMVADGDASLIAKINDEGFEQFGSKAKPEHASLDDEGEPEAPASFDAAAALARAEAALAEAEGKR